MKLLSAQQVRQADGYTIEHEPVSSIDLMERAASACCDWIVRHLSNEYHFSVFCGTGNNGGDGLAIARMLYEHGNVVNVFILRHSSSSSADFDMNLERLNDFPNVNVREIRSEHDLSAVAEGRHSPSVIIDCLFGSGLNRPAEGLAAAMIHYINASLGKVIAIDIPSGLFVEDNSKNVRENIVRADHTLTFQLPKLSFFFPSNAGFVGDFTILDIGLHAAFIEKQASNFHYVTGEDARGIYRPRKKFSHKGDYGHALLVCGSYGKMGAAVLSARACMRAGAGLLTVAVPACGMNILQTAVPEAMAVSSEEERLISGMIDCSKYHAIGAGPGIGTAKQTQGALKLLIQNSSVPLVLDADALNILSENRTWLGFLPPFSILTPHPKEFERLAGKWENDEERLKMQIEFSRRYKVYVVLKGAHTSIACPDGEVYFNSTGNPGMATAGTGDVLTGIITGLLAQKYDPKQGAVLGVYLHGLAGDIAAQKRSPEAMVAGDVVGRLGEAFRMI
jgi:ADP-dependent NAD(P)H-hydrate dehydratase / NAD(P)H-hydrate epimerase